ncbi:MAG TPA: hypothetical protein VE757_04240, partial [Gaiellaceae bacterium]|nr:hypothetical protein [Gaiellaceae bacterium]
MAKWYKPIVRPFAAPGHGDNGAQQPQAGDRVVGRPSMKARLVFAAALIVTLAVAASTASARTER